MKHSTVIVTLLAGIMCCLGFGHQRPQTHPLPFVVPQGWPQPAYDFSRNPLTLEGFELGRRLFYDGRLSRDGTLSCGSCHQQFAAFATYDHDLSHGINNNFTTRNAPPLFNLAWHTHFMWDGGINHLDLQPLAPVTAPNEMGETIEGVLQKLRQDTAYRRMFSTAFGDTTINTQRMTRALSQFVLMMVSANSKYDRVMRGEDSFNLPQRLGYAIFRQKCATCHPPPLFTDLRYRNAGLPEDDYLHDKGRMTITRSAADSLAFKVPSLRNVALTAPYSHDGRFYSLVEVFRFYSRGVVQSQATDTLLRNGIPLSNYEIGQLTAFLKTLTDSSLLTDTRFAPPGYEQRLSVPPGEHVH